MFGYACNDTPELMPLPIALAHRIINRLTEVRQNGEVDWLRPDSKSQVTVEFDGDNAGPGRHGRRLDAARPKSTHERSRDVRHEQVIKPVPPKTWSHGTSSITSTRPADSWSAGRTATAG